MTIAEQVFADLRQQILSGQLSPGERINQDEFAARFGVSRVPLREALLRLESQGLIVIIPYKGATVARLSLHDLEETYLIRKCLEPVAMRLSAAVMVADQLVSLTKLVDSLGELVDDPDGFFETNERFFKEAFEINAYRCLTETVINLRQRSQYSRRIYVWLPGRTHRIFQSRRRLLSALAARELDAVEAITREAVETARNDLLDHLRQNKRADRS